MKPLNYGFAQLKLIRAQATSRWELVAPLYRAIEAKGISIEAQEKAQGTRKAEIRMLLEEVKKMFSKELESDRPAVQAFFRSDIYDKYKLDEEFFAFKLGPVVRDKHLISKIFLEEYLAFYNEVYAQTNSLVGKKMYTTISSRLKSQRVIGEHYEEIKEDKKEWVLRYFFEEGFTRVWGSHKSTMKIVYKNILKNHLETLTEQRNYEWDLYTDGHLYAIKSENNYVFVYDKVEEKAVLSMDEYYHLLEEMLDVYLNQYFCTTSEKANWNEQKEKAGMSCGNNRN